MMQYTITLADGTQLTGLGKNGDNFVSKTKVEESIFKDNLATMTVSDGETEEVYTDMVFIQQMKWADGTFYLAFREKSQQEKVLERILGKISDTTDSITDIQVALTEMYEIMLTGGI